MMKRTKHYLSWLLFTSVLSMASSAIASDETKLTAAFIFNFIKYITWPDEVEQSERGLQLCVLGEEAPNADLRLLANRRIRSLTLSLKSLRSIAEIESCNLIYVTSPILDQLALDYARKKAVLTIGYGENFVERGGIIALRQERNRLRFDINLTQANASHLQISFRLLQLGHKVL